MTTITIPTLETERMILRGPKLADFDPWHAFFISDRSQYVGGPLDDKGKSWRAFAHCGGQWLMRGYGSFIMTLKGDDTALGMTGPWHPLDWPEQELGWTMWSADHEGTGLMYEAANAARDYAFKVLGWTTAVSYIDPDNARSIKLAERMGALRDDAAGRPHPEDLVYRHMPEAA